MAKKVKATWERAYKGHVLWQGRHNPLLDAFLKILEHAARELTTGEDPRRSLLK